MYCHPFSVITLVSVILVFVHAKDAGYKGYKISPKFPGYSFSYSDKENNPSYPQPTNYLPTYPTPTYKIPYYQQPTYQYQQPKYEQPKYEQPKVPEQPNVLAYQQPTYQVPTYQVPTYQVPTYQQPKYEQPKYKLPDVPVYQQPKYEQPKVPEKPEIPSYQQPKTEQPKMEQPMKEQPMMEEPKTQETPVAIPSIPGYQKPNDTYTYNVPTYTPKVDYREPNYNNQYNNFFNYNPKQQKEDSDEQMKTEEGDDDVGIIRPVFPTYEAPKQFDDAGSFIYKVPLIPLSNLQKNNASEAPQGNATAENEPEQKEYRVVPDKRSYQPYVEYNGYPTNPTPDYNPTPKYNPVPEYKQLPRINPTANYYNPTTNYGHGVYNAQPYPTYNNMGSYGRHTTVEGEASYYRLDTCEYRFILDMVQCHQENHSSQKIRVQDQGYAQQNSYGAYPRGPYYSQTPYPGQQRSYYPHQGPYSNRYSNFYNLYGNPSAYADHNLHSYKPDESLFSYQPAIGQPFYAPGLHNQGFAKYYAGFKAGQFETNHEMERRQYHKEGHYHSALQDFNNLRLRNVVKISAESQASERTSTHVEGSALQAYEGQTPYFNYRVRLMPYHCSLPGMPGKHACIVFYGATHPYKMVQRQFIYVKQSREVQGKYKFRYENGQQGAYYNH